MAWAQTTKWEAAMLNKRHKILVVDDEHAIASTLTTILGSRISRLRDGHSLQRRRSDSSGVFISAQLHSYDTSALYRLIPLTNTGQHPGVAS